jgi:DNA-binding transcriptional LysR family regulator
VNVEFRQLRYFVAVAEELHFRRAAQRLYVTQPALSRQIAQLEQELGVRLLERNRRRVQLTAAGDALLREARGILVQLEQGLASARWVERADQPDGQPLVGEHAHQVTTLSPQGLA